MGRLHCDRSRGRYPAAADGSAMSVAGGRRTPMRPGGGQRLATLETQAFLYPDSSPHLVGWRQAAPYPHNTAAPAKALPDQKGWLSWGVMRPKVPSTHMQYANFQAQSAVRRMVSPQLDYRRPGGLGEWRPKTPPCPAPSVDHATDLVLLGVEAEGAHGNLQLLGVDGAGAIGIEQVECLTDLLDLVVGETLWLGWCATRHV